MFLSEYINQMNGVMRDKVWLGNGWLCYIVSTHQLSMTVLCNVQQCLRFGVATNDCWHCIFSLSQFLCELLVYWTAFCVKVGICCDKNYSCDFYLDYCVFSLASLMKPCRNCNRWQGGINRFLWLIYDKIETHMISEAWTIFCNYR